MHGPADPHNYIVPLKSIGRIDMIIAIHSTSKYKLYVSLPHIGTWPFISLQLILQNVTTKFMFQSVSRL